MKTQHQHAETGRQKAADRAHGMNWLLQQPNRPTKEELIELRRRRPELWNGYKDKSHEEAPRPPQDGV
jgi:hypothetical protein